MPGLNLNNKYLETIPPNATVPQLIAVINELIEQVQSQRKTQFWYDGTTRRVVVGYLPGRFNNGADSGYAVSLPGYDVVTCEGYQLYARS